MKIGRKLKSLRKRKGYTQKGLGIAIGLSPKAAESTISQYERDARTPTKEVLYSICRILDVFPSYFEIPNLENPSRLLKELLEIEELHGLSVDKTEDGYVIKVNNDSATQLAEDLKCWYEAKEKLKSKEWTEEDYSYWKYNYPLVQPSASFEKEKENLIMAGFEIDENECDLQKVLHEVRQLSFKEALEMDMKRFNKKK